MQVLRLGRQRDLAQDDNRWFGLTLSHIFKARRGAPPLQAD
jgi:hypothetical protein